MYMWEKNQIRGLAQYGFTNLLCSEYAIGLSGKGNIAQ